MKLDVHAPPQSVTPRRRSELEVHELDDEALIFDASTGNTHRFNCTAWFIWRHCDGRRDSRAIAGLLTESYDVSIEVARQHVDRVLGDFAERQLVVTTDRAGR